MVAFVSDTPEELPQPSAAALPPSGTKQRCQLPCLLRDASLSEEKAKLGEPRRRGTFGERPESKEFTKARWSWSRCSWHARDSWERCIVRAGRRRRL